MRFALILIAVGATGCNLILGLDETSTGTGDDDPAIDAMPGDFDAPLAPDAEIVQGDCQPLSQLGCPVAEACDFDYAGNVSFCRIAGDGLVGASCGAPTDCSIGLTCQVGYCRQFCNSDAECATTFDHCHPTSDGVSFCDSNCDLRTGVCTDSSLCFIRESPEAPDVSEYVTYCDPGTPGGIGVNGDCTSDQTGCVPGSVCIDLDADSTLECAQICYVGDGSCPNCASLTDGANPLVIHGNELGVCVP